MKKDYIAPSIDISLFDNSEILTGSGTTPAGYNVNIDHSDFSQMIDVVI